MEALLGPMVLFGAGVGLCFMPLNMIIMTGMSPNDAGSGSGLLQTMQRIGGSLGVAILVTIYGTVMKHTHPAPGLGATAQAAYVLTRGIAAAFAGASAFAALALLVTFAAVSGRPAKIAEPR